MKKILNFFKLAPSRTGTFVKNFRDKIFRQAAEEEKKQQMILRIVSGVLLIIVIALIAWIISVKPWQKSAVDNGAATSVAEAKVYIVTSGSCGKKCWDAALFTDALAQQGVKIVDKEVINANSWWPFSSGKAFAKKYQITKVPTVVVEFKGANPPDITKFFSPTLGTVVDGKFVLSKILAPYYDLTEKKLKGIIKVTYLADKSCTECYDVKKHENALKNLGASNAASETIDVSSSAGQDLIKKYNITKVPTLLISGEVSEYTVLTQAWAEVGTIAADGTYIFTNLDLMGDSYKNLTTGKIIKAVVPVAPTATAPAVK